MNTTIPKGGAPGYRKLQEPGKSIMNQIEAGTTGPVELKTAGVNILARRGALAFVPIAALTAIALLVPSESQDIALLFSLQQNVTNEVPMPWGVEDFVKWDGEDWYLLEEGILAKVQQIATVMTRIPITDARAWNATIDEVLAVGQNASPVQTENSNNELPLFVKELLDSMGIPQGCCSVVSGGAVIGSCGGVQDTPEFKEMFARIKARTQAENETLKEMDAETKILIGALQELLDDPELPEELREITQAVVDNPNLESALDALSRLRDLEPQYKAKYGSQKAESKSVTAKLVNFNSPSGPGSEEAIKDALSEFSPQVQKGLRKCSEVFREMGDTSTLLMYVTRESDGKLHGGAAGHNAGMDKYVAMSQSIIPTMFTIGEQYGKAALEAAMGNLKEDIEIALEKLADS